jgi:hypothetical protein
VAATLVVTVHDPAVVKLRTTGADEEPSEQPAELPVPDTA